MIIIATYNVQIVDMYSMQHASFYAALQFAKEKGTVLEIITRVREPAASTQVQGRVDNTFFP